MGGLSSVLLIIGVIGLIVGIPWAIITRSKAKKETDMVKQGQMRKNAKWGWLIPILLILISFVMSYLSVKTNS